MFLTILARKTTVGQPAHRLSLRENVFWSFVGNAVYAASQWAVVMALARAGDARAVGQFTLALAVTAPVFVASNLQLRSVQSADVKQQFSFSDFLALRILAASAGVFVVALIGFLYSREVWLSITLMGLAKAIECIIDIVSGVFQSHERMDLATSSTLLRGAASVAAVLPCMLWPVHVPLVIAAILLSRIAVLVCYDLPLCRRYVADAVPRFRWRKLRVLAHLTWPLGVATMIGSVNANLPGYQIQRSLGTAALGIFAALSYILTPAVMMANATGQAAIPQLASALARGSRRNFFALTSRLSALAGAAGAVILLLAMCGGSTLLKILYGPEYAREAASFTAMAGVMAITLPATIVNYALVAARSFRMQIPVTAATAALTFAASSFLIPSMGLIGAPVALAAGMVLQLALTVAVLLHSSRRSAAFDGGSGLVKCAEVAA